MVIWEPGLPLICAICGIERGGADPPGPWTRSYRDHRRRIPIYEARSWTQAVPMGYLEYVRL